MHIFSTVVWLGGLMFQSAVALPVMQFENEHARSAMRKVNQRFVSFVWMSVWTMLITGVLMMLLNPRFIWFHFSDRWSMFLAFKQVIFVLMVFYAVGYARMLKFLDSPSSNGGISDKAEGEIGAGGKIHRHVHRFGGRN